MKSLLNSVVGVSLVFAVSSQTSVSFAAESIHACSCVTEASSGAVGKITALSGEALQSGDSGYVLATEGSNVSVGSLLSVGSKSAAKVSFGKNCSVLVPANSELKISRAGDAVSQICASVTSTGQKQVLKSTFKSSEALYGADLPVDVEPASETIVENDSAFPAGLLLLGAAVTVGVGYAIFELVDDDDDAPGAVPSTEATEITFAETF